MEASDALKEMTELLSEAGLAMPPIPEDLQTKMYRVRRWCYATRDVDVLEMYRFDNYLVEATSEAPEPYFAFSHAGHGINSYAINYQAVIGTLALFVQVPWGGGYMDKKRQAAAVARMFGRCADLLSVVPDEKEGPRLLVAVSDLRGHRVCGWVPSGMDEEAARKWLGSDELSVPDPLDHARRLLDQMSSS